jgi:glutaconate CoA-transferase subunit A
MEWDKISESTVKVQSWLDEWVFSTKDRDEYWKKLGPETHERLKITPRMSEPINYGNY